MVDELTRIEAARDVDQEMPYVMVGENATSQVHFLNPRPESILLRDIALGLAKSCRYEGAIPGWYSTAEHCLIGRDLASSDRVAKEFLIHDAAEYVFGDIAAPIKRMLPSYKKMEQEFEKFIYFKYLGYTDLAEEVKVIDHRLCATEQLYMRGRTADKLWAEPYTHVTFNRYDWNEAYLKYYSALRAAFPGRT